MPEPHQENYYKNMRLDLLGLLPAQQHFSKVLEIGCAEGLTGRALLQSGKADWVTGVEIVPEVAEQARKNLNEVLAGSIEQISFKQEEFELILLADVLEHLADPWQVMQQIACWLKPGGFVLCSLPNMQNWRIIYSLIKGNWQYQESGLLDNGHLRFFTYKSAFDLFKNCGMLIAGYTGNFMQRARLINSLTFGLLQNYLAYQLYFLAIKPK